MFKNVFYPLRTCVGQAHPIEEIKVLHQSPTFKQLDFEFEYILHASIQQSVNQPQYEKFLPTINRGGNVLSPVNTALPYTEQASLFPVSAPTASIFALARKTKQRPQSRELSITLSIKLNERVDVGGICLLGYPYLPFRCEKHGENSANFGLPREMRVTALSRTHDGKSMAKQHDFIDADMAMTRQQIVSHSGYHYLALDRTKTDTVLLHLSDFPEILTGIKVDDASQPPRVATKVNYGFLISQLFVYRYEESVRYRPPVPFGLLGLKSGAVDLKNDEDVHAGGESSDTQITDYDAINLQYRRETSDKYAHFSAASLFLSSRNLAFGRSFNDECFISRPLKPKESVVLYCEQGDDHRRCIAGLKLLAPFVPEKNLDLDIQSLADQWATLFPNSPLDLNLIANLPRELLEMILRDYILRIPDAIDFCEKIRIRVLELDPIDGVSPLNVPLNSKHVKVLADVELDELSEALWTYFKGIQFRQSATASYFALEITNVDDKPGQIVLKSLDFIQSAHVAVKPRPSRSQHVLKMHFRLIGTNLADDYAELGEQSFNFSIVRQVAGGRKYELMRVNCLLDLIQNGQARLLSNTRTRAVEDQRTETLGGAKDNNAATRSEARNDGWRKSETGDNVSLPDLAEPDDDVGVFESYSNQQARQHSEILSPIEENNHWRSNALIGNVMYTAWESGTTAQAFTNAFADNGDLLSAAELIFIGPNSTLVPTYEFNKLYDGFDKVWRGLADPESLKVQGMTTVNSSPFGYNNITKDLLDLIDALSASDPVTIGTNLQDLLLPLILPWVSAGGGNIYSFAAANSMGVSASVQPVGLGLTLSASTGGGLMIPSFSHINSFGSQGTITNSGVETRYSYDNRVVASQDWNNARTYTDDARSHQRTVRAEVPGTDHKRLRGAEILWQDELVDIMIGSVNLDIQMPAISDEMHHHTSDDSIQVRIGSGVSDDIQADFWFDILEEVVLDDY